MVLFPGAADDMWGTSAAVLRSELEGDGYAVEVQHSGDDIPAQLLQLRAAFEAAPTAIVIAPIEATALAAELAKSDDPDVAIISYDRLIRDAPEVDYYATFDHLQSGRLHAQSLVAALELDRRDPQRDPAQVEIIAGSGDDPAAQGAFAGAMEVLGPLVASGALVVPSERLSLDQTAVLRGTPTTAAARVAELLDEGVRLDAVLSPHDAMSAAIAEVLAERDCEVVAGVEPDAPEDPEESADPEDAEEVPPVDEKDDDAIGEEGVDPEPSCRVVVTGGGTSAAGARALLEGTQTTAVHEDPRELARVVAGMVAEVVRGAEPSITLGGVTDNGARDVPTLLLEPVLLDAELARRLVD